MSDDTVLRGRHTSMGQAGFCSHCETHMADGPDACLGALPGVSHACCGHGLEHEAYAVLGGEPDQDSTEVLIQVVLRGWIALAWFEQNEVGPARTRKGSSDGH